MDGRVGMRVIISCRNILCNIVSSDVYKTRVERLEPVFSLSEVVPETEKVQTCNRIQRNTSHVV